MKTLEQLSNMQGRLSLITGGAGHIGRAIAEALAELGSDLLLVDLDFSQSEDFVAGLKERYDVAVECYVFDLEKYNDTGEIVEFASRRFGRLDVLINNAAFVGTSNISGWISDFELQSVETWRRALDVNLTSVFSLIQSAVPLLKASGHGSIVNISSIYGEYGPDLRLYEGLEMGNPAAYAASKGGLNQLTRWLATVLSPSVRVNTLSPGGVYRQQPEEFCQRYVAKTPLGRMASEEDFKGGIAFLASDLSSYVTGQNLMIDGGFGVW